MNGNKKDKKLKEYVSEGLIRTEKKGKILYYRRAEDIKACGSDCLDFFSEVAPCGVVGSYLLDKLSALPESSINRTSHSLYHQHFLHSLT